HRERDVRLQLDAARNRGICDAEPAAELRDAVVEPLQSEVPGSRPVGRQTDAVVANADGDPLAVGADIDVHVRSLRVAQRVDQAFLHDPVDRERHARSKIGWKIMMYGETHAGETPLPVAHQALERGT